MGIIVKLGDLLQKHPLAKAKFVYFFYEAITKTLPGHLAAYYKHSLLLSPHQVSVLVAARYFAVLFGSPVMGSIADKLNTFRNILIITLLALLGTYLIVPIVEPIDGFNCLSHLHRLNNTRNETEITQTSVIYNFSPGSHTSPVQGHFYHGGLMYGFYYSWPFEAWAYEETDDITRKVFITLLMVTLIGEFFASPSETFIDYYTLQTLKNDKDKLGWQVLPGTLGWVIVSLIFLGLRLTHLKSEDFCHVGLIVAATPYLFVVYGMICVCILAALTLKFKDSSNHENDIYCSCGSLLHSKCFKALFLMFKTPSYAAFAVAVIFSGFSTGTKSIFIYSYLQDLGGGTRLIIVMIFVHMVSNSIVLITSPWLLKKYGQENLIAAGLFMNGLTFVTYSVIENPWLVMLVEPFDGLCTSLPWVAILTFVGSPPHIGAALQGLIHGLYRGLGVAIGYFVVSIFILKFGYMALFIGLGLFYFFLFGGYICVVHVWPADSISQEYTHYMLLYDNKEDFDISESETEMALQKDNETAMVDTSFLIKNSAQK